ncbi:hypothetical protein RKD19_006242 [Streptomyces canus]
MGETDESPLSPCGATVVAGCEEKEINPAPSSRAVFAGWSTSLSVADIAATQATTVATARAPAR